MEVSAEKIAQKEVADIAIDEAFAAISELDGWSKMHLVEALHASEAGLYRLAKVMAEKALTPPIQLGLLEVDPEIDVLTAEELKEAIDRVRGYPVRANAVFGWRD